MTIELLKKIDSEQTELSLIYEKERLIITISKTPEGFKHLIDKLEEMRLESIKGEN